MGKTTLCNILSTKFGVPHYSAGELIKRLKTSGGNSESDKRVRNIKGNQDILIQAIKEYVSGDFFYLLDGHFALLDTSSTVAKVPDDTFKALSPCGIMVVHDSVSDILNRITQRDGVVYDYSLLSKLQEVELEHAAYIASMLCVPYLATKQNDDLADVERFIGNLMRG